MSDCRCVLVGSYKHGCQPLELLPDEPDIFSHAEKLEDNEFSKRSSKRRRILTAWILIEVLSVCWMPYIKNLRVVRQGLEWQNNKTYIIGIR